MESYNPISFKYLSGWGDGELPAPSLTFAANAASTDELLKTLKKFNRKDREYIREQWRKLYIFYTTALLPEEDQEQALKDGYLRKLNKELGLET